MGIINEKVYSWSAQEKCQFHHDSGRNKQARGESQSFENQQKRINRADSTRSDFIRDGNRTAGKILRQLIEESESQVASKKVEILQLESKIVEFKSLLEQIEANKKT